MASRGLWAHNLMSLEDFSSIFPPPTQKQQRFCNGAQPLASFPGLWACLGLQRAAARNSLTSLHIKSHDIKRGSRGSDFYTKVSKYVKGSMSKCFGLLSRFMLVYSPGDCISLHLRFLLMVLIFFVSYLRVRVG